MGQKVSPVGLRVGVNRNWDSRWYANDQDFAGLLHEDIKVRDYILKKLKTASVAKVEIERSKNRVTIFVHTSRPGVVIGKDGEAVDAFEYLSRTEGIIPAIESAHVIAQVMKIAPKMKKDEIIIVCLSGRGDKDVAAMARYRGVKIND